LLHGPLLAADCSSRLPSTSGLPPRKLVVNRFDANLNEFAHKLAAEAIEKFLDASITPGRKPATTSGSSEEAPTPN